MEDLRTLWLRGGFPRSYLADSNMESFEWRLDFIKTFLERDIPNLGFRIPSRSLERFWQMSAHVHGHMACGFRNRTHYRKAILFHCGGLDLYAKGVP